MAPRSSSRKPKQAPAPAPADHNLQGELEKQRRAAFLVGMNNLRGARENSKIAAEALKTVKKVEKKVRTALKEDGWPLKIIDRILADEDRVRSDSSAEQEMERWMRKAVGLPVSGNVDLFSEDTVPHDAEWWFEDGKQACFANRDVIPPSFCPPEFHQDWMRGHVSAQEEIAWAMSANGVNPERKASDVAPPPPPAGDDDDDDDDHTSGGVFTDGEEPE